MENRVAFRQTEIVERGGEAQRQAPAIDQSATGVEAVEVEHRLGGGEIDAEIEQLAREGIDLRMRRERAHRIEGAAEGVEPPGLQRDGIELPGEPLLAESQERAAERPERIDAHVERRLQSHAAHQLVAGKRGAERAVERPAGGLLLGQPGAPHVAGGQARAFRGEAQGAHHAVAVQPVPVALAAALEAGRTVQVVGPAQESRDLPLDPRRAALVGRSLEGLFEPGRMVLRQILGHPTASNTSSTRASRSVRKRAMQGTSKRQE